MSERPTKQWNIGTALLATILGSLITVAGIGATFGGYKEKVDALIPKVSTLETNAVRKDELNPRLERMENKLDRLIETNSNKRRQ